MPVSQVLAHQPLEPDAVEHRALDQGELHEPEEPLPQPEPQLAVEKTLGVLLPEYCHINKLSRERVQMSGDAAREWDLLVVLKIPSLTRAKSISSGCSGPYRSRT